MHGHNNRVPSAPPEDADNQGARREDQQQRRDKPQRPGQRGERQVCQEQQRCDKQEPPGPAGAPSVRTTISAHYPPNAATTRDGLGRPSCSAIHTLVVTSSSRSTPVSTPRPSSIHTRSSVARLPVADSAYGQPPRPPAEASTVATPACNAASVFASAWP